MDQFKFYLDIVVPLDGQVEWRVERDVVLGAGLNVDLLE